MGYLYLTLPYLILPTNYSPLLLILALTTTTTLLSPDASIRWLSTLKKTALAIEGL